MVDNIGYFFGYRWIFAPLWIFHAIVARGRFSLPAPCSPHDRHVNPSSIVFFKHDEICNFFLFMYGRRQNVFFWHAVLCHSGPLAMQLLLSLFFWHLKCWFVLTLTSTMVSSSCDGISKQCTFWWDNWSEREKLMADDANSTFSLKIVFLPILILESIILIDNFR